MALKVPFVGIVVNLLLREKAGMIDIVNQVLKTKKSFTIAPLFTAIFVQTVSYFTVIIKSNADWTSVINSSSLLTTATSVLFFFITSVYFPKSIP